MEGSFARARPEIVRCFDEALQQRAHTAGLLAFRVKIAADGPARELCLGARGNVEERGLQACVGNVLARTKYPLGVEGKMTVHGLRVLAALGPLAARAWAGVASSGAGPGG